MQYLLTMRAHVTITQHTDKILITLWECADIGDLDTMAEEACLYNTCMPPQTLAESMEREGL